jgi:parallel beta-helix repeat protein
MKKIIVILLVLLFLLPLIMVPSARVKAQNGTIIVPDNYPTLTSAIGNATNGDTILVRRGTYEGPVNKTIVIDKSLSIIGEDTQKTIIKLYPAYNESWIFATCFFTYSDAITLTADYCTLRGLTFEIANPGGYITSLGNHVLIADNIITTSSSTGLTVNGSNCRITQNVIDGTIQLKGTYNEIDQNHISFLYAFGSYNFFKNNICQIIGIHNSTGSVCLENKLSSQDYEDNEIWFLWSSGNFACKNEISGNSTWGIRLWYSSGNTIEANTFSTSALEPPTTTPSASIILSELLRIEQDISTTNTATTTLRTVFQT